MKENKPADGLVIFLIMPSNDSIAITKKNSNGNTNLCGKIFLGIIKK
jgi:hypothetical protein